MQIGDDLSAAREYVTTAAAHIETMRGASDDAADVISNLSELAEGARRINARGIHRSVLNLMEAIEQGLTDAALHHKIHSLEQIISQYTEGLDEIAPRAEHTPETALFEGLAKVRETLKPLIKFVDTPSQAKALQTLIAFDGTRKAESIEEASLESLLPTTTDLILSAARRSGKSVSVSYDANGIMIPNTMALDIQNFLIELGERLVQESIEIPMRRQIAGLPASASLNVTASEAAGQISFDVEVSGRALDQSALALTSLEPLVQRGASFSMLNTEGRVIARLSGLPLEPTQNETFHRAALGAAE